MVGVVFHQVTGDGDAPGETELDRSSLTNMPARVSSSTVLGNRWTGRSKAVCRCAAADPSGRSGRAVVAPRDSPDGVTEATQRRLDRYTLYTHYVYNVYNER